MKPASFEYVAPTTLAEAVSVLGSTEEAKPLAGGQSLLPLLSLRLARPTILVDLNQIPDLDTIEPETNTVRLGALTRQRALIAQPHHPLLSEASSWIAHAAIRSRGTLGGSLAHADPAAELPTVITAVGATVTIVGPGGRREISADELFIGTLQTTLTDHEIVESVTLPVPRRWGFAELARRQGDFALVLAAVAESSTGWRIVVGGVEGTPRRCRRAEEAADAGGFAEAAQLAGREVEAADHLHATATYQRGMTTEMVRRALEAATVRGAG